MTVTSLIPLARCVYPNYLPPPALLITRVLQDEYTILNSKHAIGIHGYVLVYSVNSRKSFEMVQIVYDKIINFCGMNQIPCVIVGSKTDLPKRYVRSVFSRRRPAHRHSKSAWSVSPEDGQNLAAQTHSAYIETSAKTNTNVGKSPRPSAQVAIPADAGRVPQPKCSNSAWERSRSVCPAARPSHQRPSAPFNDIDATRIFRPTRSHRFAYAFAHRHRHFPIQRPPDPVSSS